MNNFPSTISLSIVIPVYNSADILPELLRQLAELLPSLTPEHEIILVNDGSRDESWAVIQELADRYPMLRGLNMMRNYGQHNALLAGIRAARHGIVVTMDDDLQHPPAEIPKLLAALTEGHDVVYGFPKALPHSWWRNLTSLLIKRLLAQVMGVRTFQEITAFRAFKTDLRNAFADYRNPDVLLDVLLSWGTTRFASIKVEHAPRRSGVSNYNFRRLANTAMLILTGFSTAPLRLASYVGFGFTLFGILVFAYVIIRYFIAGSIPGFPFLASCISIFSGAQLFALGIMGEYLARMFVRSMDRPVYVVQKTTDRGPETP
jgi:undecaprenyl-phosphate 4-deoxy-4-formamido-L-arabinose transferase